MRIAYLTTDEVNKGLALRLAAQWEVAVCPLELRDPPPNGEFDAVLYDWDHWPKDRPPETGASAGSVRRPVAVHGYGLAKEQARTLRREGVVVFDRLESRTLLELQRAVHQVRALQAEEETLHSCRTDNTALPDVAVPEADAPHRPLMPDRKCPSCCQPGYTVMLDAPLPGPPPAGARRKVYRNRCLRCRRQAKGMDYPFAVIATPDPGSEEVHEEAAFLCNRCAEDRLSRSAWLVLFTWVPLCTSAYVGLLALAVKVWLHGNPWRRGYLPTVGTLFLVSLVLMIVTALLVRLVWLHFRWVASKGYQHGRVPDPTVTQLAIALRKKAILSRLGLPESKVRFLVSAHRGDVNIG
jgi:hypothetical protein